MGEFASSPPAEPFWKALEGDRRIRKRARRSIRTLRSSILQNRFLQIYVSMLYEDSSSETDLLLIGQDVYGGASRAVLSAKSERMDAVTRWRRSGA